MNSFFAKNSKQTHRQIEKRKPIERPRKQFELLDSKKKINLNHSNRLLVFEKSKINFKQNET